MGKATSDQVKSEDQKHELGDLQRDTRKCPLRPQINGHFGLVSSTSNLVIKLSGVSYK